MTPSFTIYGARGSLANCHAKSVKHGGHTTSFGFETPEHIFVLDAGTGLQELSQRLASRKSIPPISMFFTHYHLDHIMGLPFFSGLYREDAEIHLYGRNTETMSFEEILEFYMKKPFWPLGFQDSASRKTLHLLPETSRVEIDGVTLEWIEVPHPQKCLAYRVDIGGFKVVVATDAEFASAAEASELIEFSRGVDYLLFDSHFTPEEYPKHKGWGHSTWETGVEIARQAELKHLILTHHAPWRTDDEIDTLIASIRKDFPNITAAQHCMTLTPDGPRVGACG